MFYGLGTLDKCRGTPENRGVSYIAWSNMLRRCYDEKYPKRPSYLGCSVDRLFLEFHDFDEWAKNQSGYGSPGFHLDKDLLCFGNKIYSPEKCIFIPGNINGLIIRNPAQRISKGLPIGVYENKRNTTNKPYISCISKRGNKFYLGSHETIEEAFISYKKARENYIKEVALHYKECIDPRAFDALMNFSIEITY